MRRAREFATSILSYRLSEFTNLDEILLRRLRWGWPIRFIEHRRSVSPSPDVPPTFDVTHKALARIIQGGPIQVVHGLVR